MYDLIYLLIPTWLLSLSLGANAFLYIYRHKKHYRYGADSSWYLLKAIPLLILGHYYFLITAEKTFSIDLIDHSATSMVRLGLFWYQVVSIAGQLRIIKGYRGLH